MTTETLAGCSEGRRGSYALEVFAGGADVTPAFLRRRQPRFLCVSSTQRRAAVAANGSVSPQPHAHARLPPSSSAHARASRRRYAITRLEFLLANLEHFERLREMTREP